VLNKLKYGDIKSVIFDVDGTLLNSMIIWNSVASDYLISRGKTPRSGLNEELRKLGGHEIPVFFQREYGVTEPAAVILDGLNKLLENFYFYTATLKPGAFGVLERLSRNGIKMCVATATDRKLIAPALKRCGIYDFFERIYTCREEMTNKRSPDIYIRAAEYLGTQVKETLVFEDALYAIITAKKAGFPVIAVYDEDAEDQQDEIKLYCDDYIYSWDELVL